MGRMAQKRKKNRQSYFQELYSNNPKRFSHEWNKRLCSWVGQAKINARNFMDDDGNRTPPVFEVLRTALDVLFECGEDAVDEYGQITLQFLEYTCCQAVSSAVNPNLFRMTNQYFYDYVENYNVRSRKST